MYFKPVVFLSLLLGLLSGCAGVTYNNRGVGPVDEAAMAADSARVRQAEREERKEFRKERREDMMDEADAIRRARGNARPVYIIR